MIKNLKIAGDSVPVKYKKMDTFDAGEYNDETDCITMQKGLTREEHDSTIVHEIVHALQCKSSLRHLGISADAWEIIAGEVGTTIGGNFKLVQKK